jgi:hypothetical protein
MGDGCRSLDTGPWAGVQASRDVVNTLTFAGEHTGNLDRLTFGMFAMSFGEPGAAWPVQFGVTIDGVEVVPFPTAIAQRPRGAALADESIITVHGIGLLDEASAGTHQVEIRFGYDDMMRTTHWMWGAGDAPSGITFNPGDLRGHLVAARR